MERHIYESPRNWISVPPISSAGLSGFWRASLLLADRSLCSNCAVDRTGSAIVQEPIRVSETDRHQAHSLLVELTALRGLEAVLGLFLRLSSSFLPRNPPLRAPSVDRPRSWCLPGVRRRVPTSTTALIRARLASGRAGQPIPIRSGRPIRGRMVGQGAGRIQ